MTARELFELVVNNRMPSLDIVKAIEQIGNGDEGISEEEIKILFSDFSGYLQRYVDKVMEKRESDKELFDLYNDESNERYRNFYVIQEFFEDAGLTKGQVNSIQNFAWVLHINIERIDHLNSKDATIGELVGDSYRKGIPNDFFYEVYSMGMTDLAMFSKVKELTDNFDSKKINLLCKDFDFYFHMEMDSWRASLSDEDIQKRIDKLEVEGKTLPMASDRGQGNMVVSDYFIPQRRILRNKKITAEKKKKIDEFAQEMAESMKKRIDITTLMDPHGLEFFGLYRLRNLLVQLKSEHTSAKLKPEFHSILNDQIPTLKAVEDNINPIHWLNGEESLRQFIDLLKTAGLIENKEADHIIQEHFRQTDQTPQSIQWSKTNRLLIYLFNKLTEAGLVDTMDRQFKLITEHFLDRHGQKFKRDSLKQDFQNMKYSSDPRGAKTIDKIIQELSD